MIQDKVLKPWQPFLTRVMRERSYHLVGTNRMKRYQADLGEVMTDLGLQDNLEGYAREVGRVENRLLWVHKQGMDFPPYILKALKESVDLYRERLQRAASNSPDQTAETYVYVAFFRSARSAMCADRQ